MKRLILLSIICLNTYSSDFSSPLSFEQGAKQTKENKDGCSQPWRCVPRCVARLNSQECEEYTSDVCGWGAECVTECRVRQRNGTCLSYGPDNCFTRSPR